ncbi:hypothetical protein L6R52_41510 [Myxococcota bacterium]|nr:hypothetical protein [Myxococcota bacterium]
MSKRASHTTHTTLTSGAARVGATLVGSILVASLVAPARASALELVPVVALTSLAHGDRVELDVDGVGTPRVDRTTLALGVTAGVSYALPARGLPGDHVHASSALGLSVGSLRGDGRLVLRQDALVTLASAGPLALRAGLGLDVHLGLAAPASTFADAAIVVAALLGPVELAWRPVLVIPLSSDDVAVLGRVRRQHVAPGLVPLGFELRVSIDALAL